MPERAWKSVGQGLSILLLAVLAYLPALKSGFIWDDDIHLTLNPCIVGPLGLKSIWTTSAARICPLTQTTFWLEHAVWGLRPFPYHLVTVLFHGANGVMLWQVLRLIKARGSWLGAVIWMLHPVQVESVAWITELKNTQSGFFFLLSTLFFARYKLAQPDRQAQTIGFYSLSLLFGAFAMASKSSTVVLPVVLGLCAWWMEKKVTSRTALNLVPLAAMAALASLLSIWTQRLEGAVGADWHRGGLERILVAGRIVWFYLAKLGWPHPLIFIYPRWEVHVTNLAAYVPALSAIVLFGVLWLKRDTWGRPLFFMFGYFVVALLPVMALVNHYFVRYSFVGDHFQYLASMGPLALVGSGLTAIFRLDAIDSSEGAEGSVSWGRTPAPAVVFGPFICGLLILTLGCLTWQHSRLFQDGETLWRDTLRKDPYCWLAHNNLGVSLERAGRIREAEPHFRAAAALKPDFAEALSGLGANLWAQGQVADGVGWLHKAIEADPAYLNARFNLGVALASQGRAAEAGACFESVLDRRPWDNEARQRLAAVLAAQGLLDEATLQYREVLQQNPTNAAAYHALGQVLALEGKWRDASEHYFKALQLDQPIAELEYNLGYALRMQGQNAEAAAHLKEALRLKPDLALAHYNLGCVLADLGQVTEGSQHLKEALRLRPEYPEAKQRLEALSVKR